MNKGRSILLKTFLRAQSAGNIIKYEKDKKKRKKAKSTRIGFIFVYLLVAFYAFFFGLGYGIAGLTDYMPLSAAITCIALSFFMTFFKADGYMFTNKDYDMVMALPISVKDVVSARFLYMYIWNLPMTCVMSFSILAGYIIWAPFNLIKIIIWIVLTPLLPMLPMVLATALSTLFAGVGTKFKYRRVIQVLLTFAFTFVCFTSRYWVEKFFKEDKIDNNMQNIGAAFDKTGKYIFTANWFAKAVNGPSIIYIVLFVAVSIALFEVFSYIVAKFYRQLNTKLTSRVRANKYKEHALKKNSATMAIAYKEFRKFLSSNNYLVNIGFGEVLVIFLCVAFLFVDAKSVISTITSGAPIEPKILIPAVPMIIHFLLGMMSSTCCSYSLEGKSYWILQSCPIDLCDVVNGKVLFQIILATPFAILGNLILSIKLGGNPIEVILCVIVGCVLSIYTATCGMFSNLSHLKLEWENEIEVIKQGAATVIYMLPNMFVNMGLVVGAVFLAKVIDGALVIAIMGVVYALLAFIFYKLSLSKVRKINV
ncbi:MAG: hypothetical protein IJM91_07540 [Lachnospiraceae bacterium]|nr:hypothetical protein [Lachnospiraceae bacterium]